ncbi:hypothetical protein RB195_019283 [Necator americanus]|uniref:Uncharacterized protein n=1 Tax=Necator americanus TaxID=51031 RepID=A0ABR1CG15_NECAM
MLEAAQRRMSLKKCLRDLREYNIPLAALLSEDRTRTSPHHEMEIRREEKRTEKRREVLPESFLLVNSCVKPDHPHRRSSTTDSPFGSTSRYQEHET